MSFKSGSEEISKQERENILNDIKGSLSGLSPEDIANAYKVVIGKAREGKFSQAVLNDGVAKEIQDRLSDELKADLELSEIKGLFEEMPRVSIVVNKGGLDHDGWRIVLDALTLRFLGRKISNYQDFGALKHELKIALSEEGYQVRGVDQNDLYW